MALVTGISWIAVAWYITFTGGPNLGTYSLIVAPIVTGLIAGRTSAGAVVGFIPNFLLGIAIAVIILRDLSHVPPGSLESVFGLFGLLGAAILATVGGLVGAICGAIGGFASSRFTRNPTEVVGSIQAPLATVSSNVQNSSTKACPRCLSTWTSTTNFCSNCGASL